MYFILSDNQLFGMSCAFLEISHFLYSSTRWAAVGTIFKVFGMTWTQTQDLPINIRVCYYWAKSAGLNLDVVIKGKY